MTSCGEAEENRPPRRGSPALRFVRFSVLALTESFRPLVNVVKNQDGARGVVPGYSSDPAPL